VTKQQVSISLKDTNWALAKFKSDRPRRALWTVSAVNILQLGTYHLRIPRHQLCCNRSG